MQYFLRALSLIVIGLAAIGCSTPRVPSLSSLPGPTDLPFIYKIDVQQGNVITQDMVARLKPNMDKKKVQFIMGTPVIKDTFNSKRWDYLYTYHHGGGHTDRRLITLIFENDLLVAIDGDVTPADSPLVAELHNDTSLKVPRYKRRSVMTKLRDKLPFVEHKPEVATPEEEAEEVARVLATMEIAEPENPYANVQEAPGEGVVVPPNAPTQKKKKGFLTRVVDSIGLGADDDEDLPEEDGYDGGDRTYRDITDQSDI